MINKDRFYDISQEFVSTNNPSEDLLIEMIDARLESDNNPFFSLTENISVAPNNELINIYRPLCEAVDELSEITSDLSKADPKKADNIFKRVVDWWYKIEPNKKFKTLHTVIEIGFKVLKIAYFVYSMIPSKSPTNLISGKIASSRTRLGKVVSTASKNVVGRFIVNGVINGIINLLLDFLGEINNFVKIKVNEKDIDTNIKCFQNSIERLEKLQKTETDPKAKKKLQKAINQMGKSLVQLERLKYKDKTVRKEI